MKTIVKILLFFLLASLWLGGNPSYAMQFDDMDEIDDVGSSNDDGDSPEDIKPQVEVTKDDIRDLRDAKQKGLEPRLVTAAAKILGRDQNNLLALNTLAVFYFNDKKFGLAKIILNRALNAHPNQAALHNNLGVIYLSEGDQRAAIRSFKKSVEVDPDYVIGATNLASIYLEYRDFNRALEPLQSGYKVVKGSLREGKAESVGVANNLAVALSAQKQADKARDIYEEILRGNSRNITVLLNYAILLVERLKAKDEALKVISKIKFIAESPKAIRQAEELEKKAKSLE
ncbi:MAG: tetratricopeptide repeat protein [Bdellovibrionaceae bacterium]|nr:tetratricopeptide repeat protein [Bdellovibrionales bacterium]MCB9086125.1 tetratricopeptide repeat protein [Pseudobdellovibrionaceae bacterium]